ncbi:SUKH-4 family immunity protein [Shewanella goraebulensis]|uniref:SUKH-4 family immunity protein n=1 Tax=Shewanella goraebulensis TaxID=3050637 RepID=UPI00254CD909|nr:SUKH-4 family immunity protein [Shewanella goraebulensis]
MHPDFEFQIYPKHLLKGKSITAENADVICKTGLPGFVSPRLYFGDFEDEQFLPLLSNWSWASDWKGNIKFAIENFPDCTVIGSGQNSDPIVLKPNDSSIYQVSSDGATLIFVNANLAKLFLTLDAFLDMVDQALLKEENALIEHRVNPLLVSLFKTKLTKIDPFALGDNALWGKLADNFSLHQKNV